MIEFSVRRPVAVIMICIGLVALGLIAAKRIPVQLLPNIQTPEFTVVTQFKGATPEEVETMLTAPIERAVSTVAGLEKSMSNSERERSEVKLNFKSTINYLETVSALRDRLDSVNLPEGATRPKILRFQANAQPVVRLAIKNIDANASPVETARVLKDILIRRLESVEGVAIASLIGAPERQIEIVVDPLSSLGFGIPVSQIPEAIQTKNKTFPAGDIQFEGKRTSVKLGQSIQSIEDLKQLIVKKDGTKVVRLTDVATVRETTVKPANRTHVKGEDSLVIEVRKEAEANTVQVADRAKETIRAFLEEYKDTYQGFVLFDQGHQIELAIDNVGESVLHGGVLAGLVIFILIQSWWPTFVVSLSMPISILITFILMYFTGISFNLMSLAGLALGVGMLVDNSTVVLDNIHIFQSRMDDKRSAALWGTKTVVGAITGSTLSTIAVFGPLAFVEGVIGQMFRDVAATVCYSLAASLFSAVFLIPMLSAAEISPSFGRAKPGHGRFDRIRKEIDSVNFVYNRLGVHSILSYYSKCFLVFRAFAAICVDQLIDRLATPTRFLTDRLAHGYNSVMTPFLAKVARWIMALEKYLRHLIPEVIHKSTSTLLWSAGITALGVAFLMWRGAELFPDEATDRLVYEIEYAPGQTVDVTENRISALEKLFLAEKGLETVSSSIGENASNQARLTFLVDERKSQELSRSIASILSQQPGIGFTRAKEAMVGDGKPVQIEIYSDDLAQLKSQVLSAQQALAGVDGLTDIETNIKADISEIVIQFSKERLSWYGADASSFVSTLRPMLMGQSGGLLQFKGDELPVQVRLPASYFDSMQKVKYLSLPQEDDKRLYLSQLANVNEHRILASIKRINRKRVGTIAANVHNTDLETVSKKIRAALDSKPGSFNWKMGGQDEQRERSQKSLLAAVLLSLFLIYLMLAAQFENLIQPLIILSAVPFCISGVALFLFLFNLNVSALVFVGFIILIGVSVNTSIVMVDFANQMVAEGRPLAEAISEATVRRMRPILVTTLSGILGLVPMAFAMGQGSAMQQPLAVTMIGGHLSATILTVLVVPIIYVRLAKAAKLESRDQID